MAALLTKDPGFVAHVRLETESTGRASEPQTGELLGRGHQLLFAPDFSSAEAKRLRAAGFTFLWDVNEQRGFLVSEALQGYAPISSPIQATNVTTGPARLSSEKLEGRACELVECTVASVGAAPTTFRVWRATDLQGFPLRILRVGDTRPLTLSCTKVRLEVPSASVFQPPEGFTRYDNCEAMMAEMAMRQENLRRKPGQQPMDWDHDGHPGAR
jgi:hypothetical protein